MFAGRSSNGDRRRCIAIRSIPIRAILLSAVPDPNVRFTGDPADGLAFSREVEKVRDFARRPAGPAVEVGPGHFVRHREAIAAE